MFLSNAPPAHTVFDPTVEIQLLFEITSGYARLQISSASGELPLALEQMSQL